MPEKKPTLTFDAIMRELKAGNFAPIYILMGEESYFIDQISNYIQEHVLSPDQQAFDQTVVFGSDINATQVADLAMQYPMMSPLRSSSSKKRKGSSQSRSWRNMPSIRSPRPFWSSATRTEPSIAAPSSLPIPRK
jgi:hypothetical protein